MPGHAVSEHAVRAPAYGQWGELQSTGKQFDGNLRAIAVRVPLQRRPTVGRLLLESASERPGPALRRLLLLFGHLWPDGHLQWDVLSKPQLPQSLLRSGLVRPVGQVKLSEHLSDSIGLFRLQPEAA